MHIREQDNLGSVAATRVFKVHAEACKALANEHRLAILYVLSQGEMCVSDLASEVGISVHNVSQHLRVLREHLLIRSRKEGQSVYYSASNPKFIKGCTLIREALIEEHQAQGESLTVAGLASMATVMSRQEQAE
jgi:ArsR family transcriptional regulator